MIYVYVNKTAPTVTPPVTRNEPDRRPVASPTGVEALSVGTTSTARVPFGWRHNDLKALLTKEQLASIQIKKLSQDGVLQTDKRRAQEAKDYLEEKAARRKKPDKEVDDFCDDADEMVPDNDREWTDWEEQLNEARRKELTTKKFWGSQDPKVLKSLDLTVVFPDIYETDVPEGETPIEPPTPNPTTGKISKEKIVDVIYQYVTKKRNFHKINLQAVAALHQESSETQQRRELINEFFETNGSLIVDEHYFEMVGIEPPWSSKE